MTQELRQELTTLKVELKKELKDEISNCRQEIDRRLKDTDNEMRIQNADVAEAQACVAELNEWKADAHDILAEMWEQTGQLRDKVTDLEGRSGRNNISFRRTGRNRGKLHRQIPGATPKNQAPAARGDQSPDSKSAQGPHPQT